MASSSKVHAKPGDVVVINDRLGEVVTVGRDGSVTVATMIETATYARDWFEEIARPVTAAALRTARLLPQPHEGVRGFTHAEAEAAADGGLAWAFERARKRPAFDMSLADAIRREGRERDAYTGRSSLEQLDLERAWRDGWEAGQEAAARRVEDHCGAWNDKGHGVADEIRALRAPEVRS